MALSQTSLDGISRYHRVIHQQTKGNDERGDGHWLQIDTSRVRTNQSNNHDQHDRFIVRISGTCSEWKVPVECVRVT